MPVLYRGSAVPKGPAINLIANNTPRKEAHLEVSTDINTWYAFRCRLLLPSSAATNNYLLAKAAY